MRARTWGFSPQPPRRTQPVSLCLCVCVCVCMTERECVFIHVYHGMTSHMSVSVCVQVKAVHVDHDILVPSTAQADTHTCIRAHPLVTQPGRPRHPGRHPPCPGHPAIQAHTPSLPLAGASGWNETGTAVYALVSDKANASLASSGLPVKNPRGPIQVCVCVCVCV